MKLNKEYSNQPIYKHSLEKHFKNALDPFDDFFHKQASSGIVLMICAVAAIIIANTGLYPYYNEFLHTKFVIGTGSFQLNHSIHHWINDGLMVLFFFTVGLEIKREILVGELADKKQAILPIAAAIGGMVVPAIFYTFFNSGEALNGWGIPMATDIAFALGVLALLGSRVPKALIGLLLAIAIVDDLGAVMVIAVFYTEEIQISGLILSGICFLILLSFNYGGIRRPLPYALVGIVLWFGMMQSGVHATLAGVITAMAVPARSNSSFSCFFDQMADSLEKFRAACKPNTNFLENSIQQKELQSMENFVNNMESPLQRFESKLHIWVSFGIIPIFALANAGIPIDFSQLDNILIHPVTIGTMFGLVFGKTIGIVGATFIVLKLRLSSMPKGVDLSQIFGISLLAGIGFTMSIFIGSLAFADQAEYLLNAKIGIVFASLIAGIGGFIWLKFIAFKPQPSAI